MITGIVAEDEKYRCIERQERERRSIDEVIEPNDIAQRKISQTPLRCMAIQCTPSTVPMK